MIPFARILQYGNIAPALPKINAIYGTYTHGGISYDNGEFYVRGYNVKGQLGIGNYTSITNRWIPVRPPASDTTLIIDMFLGYESSTMWTEKNLYVCGSMRAFGMGTSYNLPSWSTFSLPNGLVTTDIKKIQNSQNSTLMLMNNGDLYACGMNSFGEFGTGNNTSSSSFILVNTNVKDVFLVGDNASSWLIKNDDTIWRCGYGLNGELVNGGKTSSNRWTQLVLPQNRTLVQFSSQGYCVVMLLQNTVNSDIEFWGGGFARYGNMGDGFTGQRTSLYQNAAATNSYGKLDSILVSKTASNSVTVLRNTQGQIFCAGNNVFRPLGTTPMSNTGFAALDGLEFPISIGGSINYFNGLFVSNGVLYFSGNQKNMFDISATYFMKDETVPH